MSDVQILAGPPRFTLDAIREVVVRACERVGAERAVLFGPYARGDADAWSDVDLLIVCPTERRFFDRPELFTDVLDAFPGCDLPWSTRPPRSTNCGNGEWSTRRSGRGSCCTRMLRRNEQARPARRGEALARPGGERPSLRRARRAAGLSCPDLLSLPASRREGREGGALSTRRSIRVRARRRRAAGAARDRRPCCGITATAREAPRPPLCTHALSERTAGQRARGGLRRGRLDRRLAAARRIVAFAREQLERAS